MDPIDRRTFEDKETKRSLRGISLLVPDFVGLYSPNKRSGIGNVDVLSLTSKTNIKSIVIKRAQINFFYQFCIGTKR